MKCLSTDQIVAFIRNGNGEVPAVEAHLKECPKCAMEVLTARETLMELGAARSSKSGTRRAVAPRKTIVRMCGPTRSVSYRLGRRLDLVHTLTVARLRPSRR